MYTYPRAGGLNIFMAFTRNAKEEQADSTGNGYNKISDMKPHVSFHFYATLLLDKYFKEKHVG